MILLVAGFGYGILGFLCVIALIVGVSSAYEAVSWWWYKRRIRKKAEYNKKNLIDEN